MSSNPRKPTVEEEDVDDLDDLLPDFSKPLSSKQQPSKPVPPAPTQTDKRTGEDEEAALDEDFLRELQKEMEDMFTKMLDDEVPGGSSSKSNVPGGSGQERKGDLKEEQKNFQDAIKETMEKLKSSDANLTDQMGNMNMNDLLAGLEGLGDGSIDEIMYNMMEGMISKELLYEGFKELAEKYEPYLEKNSSTLPKEDLDRYKLQHQLIVDIIKRFDDPQWFDEDVIDPDDEEQTEGASGSGSTQNAGKGKQAAVRTEKELEEQKARKKELVGLITKMHEYGSPPKEIVSEGEGLPGMPPGMPGLDKDCVIC
ncbi:hypothetical protein BT69DRAFT_1290581 [Atractiella rhizophila]|nr:hypothetical protein BT69DRAFT_1290581 [Atractiella rhizophila]